MRANFFPWCTNCVRNINSFKHVLLMRTQNHREHENLKRICRDCFKPKKSFDIEALTCENYSCLNRQNLVKLKKIPLKDALNLHLLVETTPECVNLYK